MNIRHRRHPESRRKKLAMAVPLTAGRTDTRPHTHSSAYDIPGCQGGDNLVPLSNPEEHKSLLVAYSLHPEEAHNPVGLVVDSRLAVEECNLREGAHHSLCFPSENHCSRLVEGAGGLVVLSIRPSLVGAYCSFGPGAVGEYSLYPGGPGSPYGDGSLVEVPHTRLEDAKAVGNNGELEVGELEVGDVGDVGDVGCYVGYVGCYVGYVGYVGDAGRGGDGGVVDNESTDLPLHMGSGI